MDDNQLSAHGELTYVAHATMHVCRLYATKPAARPFCSCPMLAGPFRTGMLSWLRYMLDVNVDCGLSLGNRFNQPSCARLRTTGVRLSFCLQA